MMYTSHGKNKTYSPNGDEFHGDESHGIESIKKTPTLTKQAQDILVGGFSPPI